MEEIKALGVAWAVKRCAYFWGGLRHFQIIVDCNPLVSIVNDRCLDQISNDCLLKMYMLLDCYNYTAHWQAGTKHTIADALSRALQHDPWEEDMVLLPWEDEEREYSWRQCRGEIWKLRINNWRRSGSAESWFVPGAQEGDHDGVATVKGRASSRGATWSWRVLQAAKEPDGEGQLDLSGALALDPRRIEAGHHATVA
jgi:hypothetical protein